MGLDISLRFRKKGTDLTRTCIKEFNGRSEFACIRDWVGDERYGKYIPLDEPNFKSLCGAIEQEMNNRGDRVFDDDGFPTYLDDEYYWGLPELYCFIQRGPLAELHGWVLEIECDW